jgi:hypothetical protein
MTAACPRCGADNDVPRELSGLAVPCHSCGERFTLPSDRRVSAKDAKWERGLYHPLRRHVISSPILLVAISAIMPFVGLIFGFLLRADKNPNNKRIGKWCLIAAGLGVLFYVALSSAVHIRHTL